MRAEKARMDVNPRIQAALMQLDANAGIGETSMVNYAKPVLGAKKFDSSTFSGMSSPPKF